MKTLIIDAGHGGADAGAVGFGVLEKDWNLKMSTYQYNRLKELGAKVAITRTGDQTLEPVQRIAKVKNKYDYCLSNHFNAYNGKAHGVEAIHSIHASPKLADKMVQVVVEASGLAFRRVYSREIAPNRDYYFMHRMTGTTETVIIEYGFIDHTEDFKFYQNETNFIKVAEAMVELLAEMLGVQYLPKKSSTFEKQQPPSYIGKRVESIYDGQLRFYKNPSWKKQDVYGYLKKGYGFPKILDRLKVGDGFQYKVENSKGEMFYLTASLKYVKIM